MKTIINNLRPGGIFMGCFFDDTQVKKFLKENKEYPGFRLKPIGKWNKNLFGNGLSVYLKDTVLNNETIEYIVNFKEFTKIMNHLNFKLIETEMFSDIYKKSDFQLSEIDKKFSFLNRFFVFAKK
jgi:hypothetical protein